MKKPLLVFDVNETLLDVTQLSPILDRIFSEKHIMRLWYADLVLYSEALTLAPEMALRSVVAYYLEKLGKSVPKPATEPSNEAKK